MVISIEMKTLSYDIGVVWQRFLLCAEARKESFRHLPDALRADEKQRENPRSARSYVRERKIAAEAALRAAQSSRRGKIPVLLD